jgi:membrane protein insertase Oxa1/YidC/SpoIIIJ
LDIVAKGKSFTKVVPKDEKTMEEEIVTKDVVETYVPLIRNQQFVGAFEIYYDITYSDHIINKFIAESRIIILFVTLFLLLCIFLISFTAITYLKKMIKAEKKVQTLKEQIPPLYNLPTDDLDD